MRTSGAWAACHSGASAACKVGACSTYRKPLVAPLQPYDLVIEAIGTGVDHRPGKGLGSTDEMRLHPIKYGRSAWLVSELLVGLVPITPTTCPSVSVRAKGEKESRDK